MRALSIVRETHPDLPFIILSCTIGKEAAVEAIKKEANDYLLQA